MLLQGKPEDCFVARPLDPLGRSRGTILVPWQLIPHDAEITLAAFPQPSTLLAITRTVFVTASRHSPAASSPCPNDHSQAVRLPLASPPAAGDGRSRTDHVATLLIFHSITHTLGRRLGDSGYPSLGAWVLWEHALITATFKIKTVLYCDPDQTELPHLCMYCL